MVTSSGGHGRVLHVYAVGGALVVAAAGLSVVLANSGFGPAIEGFWSRELRLGVMRPGDLEDVRHLVNEGLMTLYFFVAALHVKRERIAGILRDPATAALPLWIAAGGVALPVTVYLLIASPVATAPPWGLAVPTDTVVVIGLLALLGARVPIGLKHLLLTVALLDDLVGLVVVVAGSLASIDLVWLGQAGIAIAFLVALRGWNTNRLVYGVVALLLWVCLHRAGFHATVAGVVLAALTPRVTSSGAHVMDRVLGRLQPVVVCVVLPLFVAANAGFHLDWAGVVATSARSTEMLAIGVALIVGKALGFAVGAAVAMTTGAAPPVGVTSAQVLALAPLCGVVFTVALLIADVTVADPQHLADAKLALLGGSLVSAAIGLALVGRATRRRQLSFLRR